ncbi:MAG: hypothetical protein ACYS80_10725 [Planctomycetota bacterium]|jgi:hypothetical protein
MPQERDPNLLEGIFNILDTGQRITSTAFATAFLGQDLDEWWTKGKDWDDIVDGLFPDAPDKLKAGMKLGSKIFFDPLTYTGFGTFIKGGAGAKALVTMGGKQLVKGEGILRAIEHSKAALGRTGPGGFMVKAFGNPQTLRKYVHPELAADYTQYIDDVSMAMEETFKTTDDIIEQLMTRGLTKQDEKDIINYLETIHRGTPEQLQFAKQQVKTLASPDGAAVYDMASMMKFRFEDRWEKIVPGFREMSQAMFDRMGVSAHMPHVVNNYKKLSKKIPQSERIGYKERDIAGAVMRDVSPAGLMKRKQKGTLGELVEKHGEDVYETSLPVIMGHTASELAHAEAAHKYLMKVVDKVGVRKSTLIPSEKIPKGFVPVKANLVGLGDAYVPKYLESEVIKLQKAITGIDEVSHGILGAFDAGTNWFRRTTLFIFPNYHIRNQVGDWWLNHVAGDVRYGDYVKSGAMITRKMFNKATDEDNAIFQMMQARNVLEGGMAAEVGNTMTGSLKRAWMNGSWVPLAARWKPIEAGIFFSAWQSNFNKTAHFLSRIRNGFSPDEAALSVKKHLFQYGREGLSTFEQNVMRRMIPFYTWMRKNLPRQMEALIQRPGKFANLGKFIESVEGLYGPQPVEKWMSEFMRQGAPVYLGESDVPGQSRYFLLKNWLPAADLLQLEDPINEVISMTNPFLKEPLQQLVNWDFFFEDKITRVPEDFNPVGGELDNFLSMTLNKRLSHLMKNVRLLNTLDKLNPLGMFGEDRPHHVDPDETTRWIRITLGRMYPYDPNVARIFYERNFKEKIAQLRGLIAKSAQRGNQKEALIYTGKLHEYIRKSRS